MSSVRIDLTPRRPAVCSDAAISLDLLVRIAAPLPESGLDRPSLNLSLVIDRSGSMGEDRKLDYARQAAAFAVGQLLPEDRVAVTVFDDEVRTIAPSAPAADLPGLVQRIEAIRPGGSTDLHGGWAEGGRQAESHRRDGALNRVILLSDGLANQGLTDPNAIATEAKGLALRGVSTTTVGLGEQYNEDLLEAMARAGDGNYYYVESPTQLPDLYRAELHGLMATVGRAVRLEIEPAAGRDRRRRPERLRPRPRGRLAAAEPGGRDAGPDVPPALGPAPGVGRADLPRSASPGTTPTAAPAARWPPPTRPPRRCRWSGGSPCPRTRPSPSRRPC